MQVIAMAPKLALGAPVKKKKKPKAIPNHSTLDKQAYANVGMKNSKKRKAKAKGKK